MRPPRSLRSLAAASVALRSIKRRTVDVISLYGRTQPADRPALVAQDGLTIDACPWADIDALFIGGTTAWKLGPQARALVAVAKMRGKHIHMGRVNSERRYRYAAAIGCDSADGTYLTFGPDRNLPNLLAWTRLADQPALTGVA